MLHGVGVLLNCVDLTRLLSLSAALAVCLKATAETDTFVREKGVLLAAIDRCSLSTSVPDDAYSAIDLDQDDTAIEIEPESGKIRHISPFSIALRRRIAEKMRQAEDETSDSDSANILCSPKVLDYLEVYIFPLALLWSGLLLGEVHEKFVCQECFNLILNVLNLSPISIKKCNVTGGCFLGTISRAVEARTRALISTPMAFFSSRCLQSNMANIFLMCLPPHSIFCCCLQR